MLCETRYTKDYIAQCRSIMASQLAAYRGLVDAAKNKTAPEKPAFNSALEMFEPLFFNHLVLVLDRYFIHRSRTMEGKDGNPLNEVRMLCNSIVQNQGVQMADKTIKFNPPKSILKIPVGLEVKLTESGFALLFRAFFAEIETKFS